MPNTCAYSLPLQRWPRSAHCGRRPVKSPPSPCRQLLARRAAISFQAGIGYAPEWLIWVPCATLTPTVLERAESAMGNSAGQRSAHSQRLRLVAAGAQVARSERPSARGRSSRGRSRLAHSVCRRRLSGVREGADQAAPRLRLQSPHVIDVRGVRDDDLRPPCQIRERLVLCMLGGWRRRARQ